ncbi:23S rRNA (guanosine(2251)-2'-O)-methyltransferase RlmB [Cryomorphaceae bacterium 1068]|nr:23S rRNA (guanosine(2251)-2'-O)-methyltransferase RlmB [Cryomorphaceae bacterium 1068]
MKNKEFIAYGIHPISEALNEGKPIEKVLVQKGLKGDAGYDVVNGLRKAEVPIQYVPKAKLDRITGKNHQGMIAFISPIEYQNIEWLLPDLYEKGETPLILVLDGVTDVRNFGAICRTAECAGVHAVVVPTKGSAQIGPDAIKTSAGALLQIPICRSMNLTETLNFLKSSGLRIIACHEKAELTYTDADLTTPSALVMGSEESGIQIENLATSTDQIRIALKGRTSSLNVSTATGIILFETLRQRSMS